MNNKEKTLWFQKKLLSWYEENKRDYPWRVGNNPYYVLISEVMLQKTNAAKVEKNYANFIKEFPDINSLNDLTKEKMKEHFEYLGLYNQKFALLKNIHDTITKKFQGKIPTDRENLKSIKGVGDYMANAVLCFGYNLKVPIIDGNFIRILERFFGIISEKKSKYADKFIWDSMGKILPETNYRDFNYAILDFAAKICKFYNPQCENCVVKKKCIFHFNAKSSKKNNG